MKTINLSRKLAAFVAIGLLGLVTSCKDKELVNGQDVADAASESLADSYYQDSDDVSLYSVDYESNAKGRVAAGDDRVKCATFTALGSKTEGTLVVDFGTGCTDSKGNVRKGKINIAYLGTRGYVGFKVTVTFTEYSINGIALQGTRIITRVEPSAQGNIKHSIVLNDGKATWPDNTFATRSSTFERELDPTAGTVTLTGEAHGTGRKGKEYSMTIFDELMYKASCIADGIYMAVSGTKIFLIDGKTITINYGDGTCDKKVTLTVNGLTRDVTVAKN